MVRELLRLLLILIAASGSASSARQQKSSHEDKDILAASSRRILSPNHEFDFRGCGGGVIEPTLGSSFSPAGIWDTYSMISAKASETGAVCWPLGGAALDGLSGYVDLELPALTMMPRRPSDAPRPVENLARANSSVENKELEDFEGYAALSVELLLRVDIANGASSSHEGSSGAPMNDSKTTIFDLYLSATNESTTNGSSMRLGLSSSTSDENWAPGGWKHALVVVQRFRNSHKYYSSSRCKFLPNASSNYSNSRSACLEVIFYLDGKEAVAIASVENHGNRQESSEGNTPTSGGLRIDGTTAPGLALGSIHMRVGAPIADLEAVDNDSSPSCSNNSNESTHSSNFGGDCRGRDSDNVGAGQFHLRGTVGVVRLWRGHALGPEDAVALHARAAATENTPEALEKDNRVSGHSNEFEDTSSDGTTIVGAAPAGDSSVGTADDPPAAKEDPVDPVQEALEQAAVARAAAVAEGTTFFGVSQQDAAAIVAQIEQEDEMAKIFSGSSQSDRSAPKTGRDYGTQQVDGSHEPWIGVCLTGALRAMAAKSVKDAFVAAMHQLSYSSDHDGNSNSDGVDMDLFAHVSLGAAATNKDQSFEASPLQVAQALHVLNHSFHPMGHSVNASTGSTPGAEVPSSSSSWQKSRMRVAAVKYFDDSAHYAPHSQCPSNKQVPRAAFWQLYKVADCFHTMVKPAELAYTAARYRRHQRRTSNGTVSATSSPSSGVPPFRYTWLVRARWDLGYVSPLPPLRKMASTHVHVPYNYWPFSDQFALVPRRLANAYFTAVESYYLCTEAWWFPPAVGSADLLLAKHLATHQVPVSLVELHAPIARLRSEPNGWCGHQLTPFMMGGFVVDVATVTPGWSQPLQNALRSAAQCLCEHRFRQLDAEFAESAMLEFNHDDDDDPFDRGEEGKETVARDFWNGSGDGTDTDAATVDISFRAPIMDWFAPIDQGVDDEDASTATAGKIPASESFIPSLRVQPLSCGTVNPLRGAANARLNDGTFNHKEEPNNDSSHEDSHKDQDKSFKDSSAEAWVHALVPSELTCKWPTMPRFQLGHTDFGGEQHIAQLTLAPMHPPETLAVLSALRAVVTAYSSVLDATIAAHSNLVIGGGSNTCGSSSAAPKRASTTTAEEAAAKSRTEENTGNVDGNSGNSHPKCSTIAPEKSLGATRALAEAMGSYTVAMHGVLGDADYKMFLKPPASPLQ